MCVQSLQSEPIQCLIYVKDTLNLRVFLAEAIIMFLGSYCIALYFTQRKVLKTTWSVKRKIRSHT